MNTIMKNPNFDETKITGHYFIAHWNLEMCLVNEVNMNNGKVEIVWVANNRHSWFDRNRFDKLFYHSEMCDCLEV